MDSIHGGEWKGLRVSTEAEPEGGGVIEPRTESTNNISDEGTRVWGKTAGEVSGEGGTEELLFLDTLSLLMAFVTAKTYLA